MHCPHCRSTATTKRRQRTTLGYQRFNCRACGRRFNERTGTPFNDLQYPTDLVLLAVLWRRAARRVNWLDQSVRWSVALAGTRASPRVHRRRGRCRA